MDEFEFQFVCAPYEDLEQISYDFYNELEGLISERDHQIFVSIDGRANDPIASAIGIAHKLRSLGLRPLRVDPDLVDASEIALRLDRTRQNVQQWATGERKANFPRPIATIAGKRIWTWAEVVAWANANMVSNQPLMLSQDQATVVNAALLKHNAAAALPVNTQWSRTDPSSTILRSGGHKGSAEYEPLEQTDFIRAA